MLKPIVDRILATQRGQVAAIDAALDELRETASALCRLRKMADPATDLKAMMRLRISKHVVHDRPLHVDANDRTGLFVSDGERTQAIGELVARRGQITVGAIAETLHDSVANIYLAITRPGIRHYFSRDEAGLFLTSIGSRRFACRERIEQDFVDTVCKTEGKMIRAYHGSPVRIDKFEFQPKVEHKQKHDTDGPGIYFTSSRQDARTYGKYLYTVDLHLVHAVPTRGQVCRDELISVINELTPEERYDVFSDWDEDPGHGMEMFLRQCDKEESLHDAFLSVWFDCFYRAGNTARYLKAMRKIGYDGVIIAQRNDITHFVVFDTDRIKLIKTDELTD